MKKIIKVVLLIMVVSALSGCFHIPRGADGEIMYGSTIEANTHKLRCLTLIKSVERKKSVHDWCLFEGNKIAFCPEHSSDKMTPGKTYWVYTNDFPSTYGNVISSTGKGINDFDENGDAQECLRR